jgi:N-acetylglucosamine malate deacetylase 1
VLAIAAHRDDVEQTCGGTLLRMASRGLRTAILDLTQGEAGTRGSAEDRAREAAKPRAAGRGLAPGARLPDGAVENTLENRIKIVRVLRLLRPRVVILPYWQARHPDHAMWRRWAMRPAFSPAWPRCSQEVPAKRRKRKRCLSLPGSASALQDRLRQPLCRRAAQLHRGHHALHRAAPRGADGLPLAIREPAAGSGLFVPEEEIRERTFAEARHYGLLAGVRYGEPFVQKEVGLVDDLTLVPVQSI